MPNYWRYVRSSGRYQVTREGAEFLGVRNGTFISAARRVEMRDEWTAAQKLITDRLATDWYDEKIKLSEWLEAMRQENRINYVEQYLLGHGGRNNMTQADWGRIGQAVKKQNEYLQGFANDLMNRQPELTLNQIKARARQYVDGSTAMYERATALALGMPDLPEYPADGNQQCHSNCKCSWDIKDMGDHWICTWVLDMAAEHCPDCLENAAKWGELRVDKNG